MIQYVLEALYVLSGNRTRSFLTALGLIIGVMAVISIQVLGAGLSGGVNGALGQFNDHSFFVAVQRQANFQRALMTLSDIARVKATVPNVVEVIPVAAQQRVATIGKNRARLQVASAPDGRFVSTPLQYGRYFTIDDVNGSASVAILTDDAETKLSPGEDPTGKSLRIGDRRYVIVGVYAKPKTGIVPTFAFGDVLLPHTTYEQQIARGFKFSTAQFFVADSTQLTQTEDTVKSFLTSLKAKGVQYRTQDRKTLSGSIDGIFTVLTFVVALIGAVSLVVAGIGILNIMLVSVAERTREIGLRKAIGATRFQILLQFFIEALLLSAFGCAIGLVLGLAIGAAINALIIVQISGVIAPIPWLKSVLIATGFATLVTVVFGTYPAYRAASLDPIEALRYE